MKTRAICYLLTATITGLFIGTNIGILLHCSLIASQRKAEQAAARRWRAIAEHWQRKAQGAQAEAREIHGEGK